MFHHNKTIKVTPMPFVITFDTEADGGPQHFLHLLVGYCVRLRKKGTTLVDGLVIREFDSDKTTYLVLRSWDDGTKDYDGPEIAFDVWNGTFDEVMYL